MLTVIRRCGLAFMAIGLGFVLWGGRGTAAVLDVPGEYPTIAAAVQAAASGDTVLLAPGTYRGAGNRDVLIGGKDLTIQSREGPAATIIDCERLGGAFTDDIYNFESTRIEGLSIINARRMGFYGGAVAVMQSYLTVRDCVFKGCEAAGGGAVGLTIGSARIERCHFIGNSCTSQGGGALLYMGFFRQYTLECTDCVFTGNESQTGRGGAVLPMNGGEARIVGCTITSNRSGSWCGGIYAPDCPLTLERTICRGNCDPFYQTGDDILAHVERVTVSCSNLNVENIYGNEVIVGEGVIDVDPIFCDPVACGGATIEGDYTLRSDSPCLPDGNSCGVLMGGLGIGCSAPEPLGACCFVDGTCLQQTESECQAGGGAYLGDGTDCDPNPCIPTATEKTTWGRIRAGYR